MTETAVPPHDDGQPRAVVVFRDRLVDLWRTRELLRQFVGKELKVRYKNSALGFLWSLLTPAMMTVVFTAVFATIIRIEVADFAAFFLSGYLVWQFFQNSAQASVQAITGNGPLITKVWFPREILPLSIVLSQAVHFALALLAVSPYLVWSRGWGVLTHLPAAFLGLVLLILFTAGMSMLLAGANVFFRDLQELVVVLFLIWFYITPIIYPEAFVAASVRDKQWVGQVFDVVLRINPMRWFVQWFRHILYGSVRLEGFEPSPDGTGAPIYAIESVGWPTPTIMAACTLFAVTTFVVGYALFNRHARSFAKEI